MNINKDTNAQEGQDTQSDFDLAAATADISSELFGQGDEEGEEGSAEGEGSETSGGPSADASEASPQQDDKPAEDKPAEGEDNSAEVEALGAPKTWTKESLTDWAAIPDRAKQEILKREEDFLKGITQYKAGAELGQRYDTVVEPYKPILAAEGIDPVQMFQSFAANHYLLTRGTPQQKIELAANMLMGYQIPLPELLEHLADNPGSQVDPEIAALRKEIGELKNFQSKELSGRTEAAQATISREIEAFAADPAHPYFDELADDISKLFGSGMANTLAEAYEKAVFANPNTRQKELDRLTAASRDTAAAEEQARKDKIAKSTAADVTLTPKSRDGTVPVGSIDDTLSETMARIESRA